MTRNIFVFLATFVVGALIALVARAAMFKPHAAHEGHPAPGGDYSAMVSNSLAPANPAPAKPDATPTMPSVKPKGGDQHANHDAAAAVTPTATNAATAGAANRPVNSLCAICGMEVNPNLPTAEYQGKKIGFGCKLCLPKFMADPDRFGPSYLRNEVIKK